MGVYARDLREADVARHGHVAEPSEPMQTHVDTYVARGAASGWVCGPMGIVGPL